MSFFNYLLPLRKRKTHVFCIGAAKTGTTSISHIFNPALRTAHEPEVQKTTDLVIDYLSNKISYQECKQQLKYRDRRLNLELESSHPLGYLAKQLIEIFPESKFIVTIREPKAWLKSRINFHLNKTPKEWIKYREFIWSRNHVTYDNEETYLKENNLYSLEAYLKQYSEQYKIILSTIPKEKMIVVRTNDISSSVEKISDFIDCSHQNLHAVHTNKLENNLKLESKISNDFVDRKINQYCGWINNKFFDFENV